MSDNKKFSKQDNIINELEVLDLDKELDPIFKASEEEILEEENNEKTRKRKEEEAFNLRKELRSWALTLVITLGLIYVLKNYVIINAMVPTGSMENTIMPEDQLFGNRLAYMNEEPQRGDIIFFYYPDDESQKFVKRIIGLPGEKVVIKDSKVYINDSEVPLDEPYLKNEWITRNGPYEFQVPEDCYFVMGDNRNTSQDARSWINTYVHREKIIGKAVFIYFPLDRMGVVE